MLLKKTSEYAFTPSSLCTRLSTGSLPQRRAQLVHCVQCAFKIERTLEAKTVKAEARVLKSLQPCSHVVRLVEQGSIDGRSFMVMEVSQEPKCIPCRAASVCTQRHNMGVRCATTYRS